MTIGRLKYIAEATLHDIDSSVEANLERYVDGTFEDLASNNGWSIELNLDVDLGALEKLDPDVSPASEIENSLMVWEALPNLTPGLASEERIWTRLAHLEGLSFARRRWLSGKDFSKDKEALADAVRRHFFADTQTKRRDDNAISRLWWNGFIAKSIMPDNQKAALKALLKTADIRSNLIERPRTVSRVPLAAGIVRAMNRDAWITQAEENFRSFMKVLNRFGGGELFEVMTGSEIDGLLVECTQRAQQMVK